MMFHSNIQSLKASLLVVVFSALIFYCFIYVYDSYIYSNFSYYGFSYGKTSIFNKAISLFFYIAMTAFIRKSFTRPSDFFILYVNLLVLLPASVMFYYGGVSDELFYSIVISYFLMLSIVFLGQIFPPLNLSPLNLKPKFIIPIFLFLSFVLILIYVRVKGANLNFNLSEIYSYRESGAGSFTGVMAYVVKWLSYCIFPFTFIWAILRKSKWLILFSILGQVVIFGFTNHKSYFFNIVLIFFVYLGFKISERINVRSLILFQFLFLSGSLLFLFLSLTDYSLIGSLFFRRMFFWPTLISDSYIVYSQQNGYLFYSNELPVADLISSYMGRGDEYTNAGFIANSFLQGGWHMLIFSSFLVGVVLMIYNRILTNRLPIAILSCLCVITFRPLLASDLLVAFLSNGVAFMFILQILLFSSLRFYERK